MKYSVFYVLSIVIVNMAFDAIPPVVFSDGTIWSVGSVLAGAVFVARDYAQREIGHKVIALMLAAILISYFMASPFIALASVLAFSSSELIDWAVYSLSKMEFKKRVVLSSIVSVPIDTAIFLYVIDSISMVSFLVMIASKILAISIVWRLK